MIFDRYEFFEEVRKRIGDHLPEHIKEGRKVNLVTVMKNNDTELHGITVNGENENIASPTIYLDGRYLEYVSGKSISEIVEDVVSSIIEFWGAMVPEEFEELIFDNIEDKLIFMVVDSKLNEKMLKEYPHITMECGLAFTYGIKVGDCGMIKVSNDMMYQKGFDLLSINRMAMTNMEREYKPVLECLDSVVLSSVGENVLEAENPDTEGTLYVLSNKEAMLGASCLFYEGVAEKIGELFKSDYYIMPASRHQLMIVPDRGKFSAEFLSDLIKRANMDFCDLDDLLSDSLFIYKYDEKKIVRVE